MSELTPNTLDDMRFEPTAEARHGRSQQVWDEQGAREVMACVPIDRKEQRIMLISSKRYPDEWIIPKGGWESDESRERSAEREAWEEAGVLGRITRVLGRWDQYRRRHPDEIKSRFSVFELAVTETRDIWPEQSSRQRKWFTYEEAQAVLKRDWMLEAVRHAIHGTAQSASS